MLLLQAHLSVRGPIAAVVLVVGIMAAGILAGGRAFAQDMPGADTEEIHVPHQGSQPALVMPTMNASRGRVYFATRACVICHKVNGIGGDLAPPLDLDPDGKEINVFDFVTRMWRGARSMVALQDSLFGESIDLAPDELADIIAFVYDAEERKKFSENDIPKFIRDFMAARSAAPRR
jgi:mono/diheme cytochrome c family protein